MPELIYVFDTETTGDAPPHAAVCEIAAVPVTFDGKVLIEKAASALVNPGHAIPCETRAVHHISDRDVLKAPMIERLMKTKPWSDIRKCAVVAAHNVEFDWRFLEPHCGSSSQLLCTYRAARHLYPDAPNHKNQTLRYYLGCEPPKAALKGLYPHRALYDAVVTAYILAEMLKAETAQRLMELRTVPVLLRTVPFGQHRGKSWADVPPDYLRWVLRQDFEPDVKHTATHWLRA